MGIDKTAKLHAGSSAGSCLTASCQSAGRELAPSLRQVLQYNMQVSIATNQIIPQSTFLAWIVRSSLQLLSTFVLSRPACWLDSKVPLSITDLQWKRIEITGLG